MANTQVLVLKDKVQRYLTDLVGSVQIDRDGDFTARQGSSRIFIRCVEWGEDKTIVTLMVPLLLDVQPSAELFRHVALHSNDWIFGHLYAVERDGRAELHLGHKLLGDYLDPEELKSAVAGMALTADHIDDELKNQFGGNRFHEDDK